MMSTSTSATTTVLADNSSTRMFNVGNGNLDVTGSILWGSIDRGHPFHFMWYHGPSATMTHRGCVLVRQHDNDLSDIPGALAIWAGYPPMLGDDFAPSARSAAIDHCDSAGSYSPPTDAYDRRVYDSRGVAARWNDAAPYNHDLGAVEQTDVIYSSSFGKRDANVGQRPDYPAEI